MKSVNLDIWSTQTVFYEVSQLRYLINTNNEYYNPMISDQHKQWILQSNDIWSTQTMNITIQWYLINKNNEYYNPMISDQHKQWILQSNDYYVPFACNDYF
jgi:hypothetical protein